jgi:hypothetical protein
MVRGRKYLKYQFDINMSFYTFLRTQEGAISMKEINTPSIEIKAVGRL